MPVITYILLIVVILSGSPCLAFQNSGYVLADFFGEKGTEPGMMTGPEGISVDSEGNIYVADTGNNRIQKFSPEGILIKMYGGFGWGEDQFDEPCDITAVFGLDVFVADRNNHRIMRFDRKLNYISSLGVNALGDEAYRFQYPAGISVSRLRDTFVIDSENKRVIRFNSFDAPEVQFGGFSSTGMPLNVPVGIAEFNNNRIYVTDAGQNCIIVFDYFGNYIDLIGKNVFKQPSGLCTDSNGNIYVCDTGMNDVKVFDNRGRLTESIKHPGFQTPRDVAVDEKSVFVLDQSASKIFIFRISNK